MAPHCSKNENTAISGCILLKFRIVKLLCILILCQLVANKLFPQSVTISGFITDKTTGEPLIAASIYDSTSYAGTSSNNRGFYSLSLDPGARTIMVSFVGYQPVEYRVYLIKDTIADFGLDPGVELEEVTVRSVRTQSDFIKGRLTIPISRLNELPALGGETDIIKALTTLPGIASANEGSSGMVVRGGGTDQNLFILDGIPVYSTGHLFDFISVFNPDVVKRLDFYKGPFPSRYGGRLSSVTDITFRDGNTREVTKNFEIGLINSKFTIEGPVDDKTTFLLSLRSTYLDLFTPIRKAIAKSGKKYDSDPEIPDRGQQFVMYTFGDLNFRVKHRFNSNNSASINLFHSIDYYRLFDNATTYDGKSRYSLFNTAISLKSDHVFGPRLFASTMLGYTSNTGKSDNDQTNYHTYSWWDPLTHLETKNTRFESSDSYRQKSFTGDIAAAFDFTYYANDNHSINFGAAGTFRTFQPGSYSTELRDTLDNIKPLKSVFRNTSLTALEGSLYVEDEWKIGKVFRLTGGLRFNRFTSSEAVYSSLDPRFSIAADMKDAGSLVLSWSQMTQYIHALIRNDILLDKTVWVPSMARLAPEKANQLTLGFMQKSKGGDYSFGAEVFYKKMRNLVEYKINYLTTYSFYQWEKSLETNGTGEVFGGEFLAEKTSGKVTGNINYSLTWSNRQFSGLNGGRWFPAFFDRRHILNITGSVRLNEAWKASFFWTVGSGHRINFPSAQVASSPYVGNYFVYEGINSNRLPVYHRLDLGAEWQKINEKGDTYGLKFNIYNAYCRFNAYYIYVNTYNLYDSNHNVTGTASRVRKLALLPIIPAINFYYRF